MIVRPIKTPRITAEAYALTTLLDAVLPDMSDNSVLAITSKVVSLCEGAVVPIEGTDKQALIHEQADLYLDDSESMYGVNFTIAQHSIIPNAGIDESNADDVYVLWPKDPQTTANTVRAYLRNRFGHKNIGVIITDSTCRPMRRGISGIAIGFSGFKPLKDYVGKPDLFGRPMKVSQADVVGSLATAAVLVMGEGAESTPLALIQEVPFVEFVDHDPTPEDMDSFLVPLEKDLFSPFLLKTQWIPGRRKTLG